MSRYTLGYNTNGFAHHRLDEAVEIIAELGYGGIALTLDVHHLDPFDPEHEREASELRKRLDDLGLSVVVESGARFNLDPKRKHYPSLLCERDGERRLDFLKRCHDTALILGAEVVALWAGHDFEERGFERGLDLMAERLGRLIADCAGSGVRFAFEPEPGMLIETLDQYDLLAARLDRSAFGLALDLGHLLVTQECEPADALRARQGEIFTAAIEDMRRGVHDHLPFGEGDLDLPAVLSALDETAYDGMLSVELSRSSPDAVQIARASMAALRGPH